MKVAIFGGGVVGGGVVELLRDSRVEIKYLVVRDALKTRDFVVPHGCQVTSDVATVLKDDSVQIAVELMGGVGMAWDVVKSCLERGIDVVTANKALISKKLRDIEKILSTSDNPPVFLYEAAVCGGIPIVNTLLRGLRADKVISIEGVMNGSTNWMLDRMESSGQPYASLLEEAKRLGFLEADPSADILGWDTRSKLCILSRIGFGLALDEDCVTCVGIDRVSQEDISYAKSVGKSIKLVARTWTEAAKVHALVMPTLVPKQHSLGTLPGATNCVCVNAQFSNSHVLSGSGAGRYPTANSVVADILEIVQLRARGCIRGGDAFGIVSGAERKFDPMFCGAFYVRAVDESGKSAENSLTLAGVPVTEVGPGYLITGPCQYQLLSSVAPKTATILAIL